MSSPAPVMFCPTWERDVLLACNGSAGASAPAHTGLTKSLKSHLSAALAAPPPVGPALKPTGRPLASKAASAAAKASKSAGAGAAAAATVYEPPAVAKGSKANAIEGLHYTYSHSAQVGGGPMQYVGPLFVMPGGTPPLPAQAAVPTTITAVVPITAPATTLLAHLFLRAGGIPQALPASPPKTLTSTTAAAREATKDSVVAWSCALAAMGIARDPMTSFASIAEWVREGIHGKGMSERVLAELRALMAGAQRCALFGFSRRGEAPTMTIRRAPASGRPHSAANPSLPHEDSERSAGMQCVFLDTYANAAAAAASSPPSSLSTLPTSVAHLSTEGTVLAPSMVFSMSSGGTLLSVVRLAAAQEEGEASGSDTPTPPPSTTAVATQIIGAALPEAHAVQLFAVVPALLQSSASASPSPSFTQDHLPPRCGPPVVPIATCRLPNGERPTAIAVSVVQRPITTAGVDTEASLPSVRSIRPILDNFDAASTAEVNLRTTTLNYSTFEIVASRSSGSSSGGGAPKPSAIVKPTTVDLYVATGTSTGAVMLLIGRVGYRPELLIRPTTTATVTTAGMHPSWEFVEPETTSGDGAGGSDLLVNTIVPSLCALFPFRALFHDNGLLGATARFSPIAKLAFTAPTNVRHRFFAHVGKATKRTGRWERLQAFPSFKGDPAIAPHALVGTKDNLAMIIPDADAIPSLLAKLGVAAPALATAPMPAPPAKVMVAPPARAAAPGGAPPPKALPPKTLPMVAKKMPAPAPAQGGAKAPPTPAAAAAPTEDKKKKAGSPPRKTTAGSKRGRDNNDSDDDASDDDEGGNGRAGGGGLVVLQAPRQRLLASAQSPHTTVLSQWDIDVPGATTGYACESLQTHFNGHHVPMCLNTSTLHEDQLWLVDRMGLRCCVLNPHIETTAAVAVAAVSGDAPAKKKETVKEEADDDDNAACSASAMADGQYLSHPTVDASRVGKVNASALKPVAIGTNGTTASASVSASLVPLAKDASPGLIYAATGMAFGYTQITDPPASCRVSSSNSLAEACAASVMAHFLFPRAVLPHSSSSSSSLQQHKPLVEHAKDGLAVLAALGHWQHKLEMLPFATAAAATSVTSADNEAAAGTASPSGPPAPLLTTSPSADSAPPTEWGLFPVPLANVCVRPSKTDGRFVPLLNPFAIGPHHPLLAATTRPRGGTTTDANCANNAKDPCGRLHDFAFVAPPIVVDHLFWFGTASCGALGVPASDDLMFIHRALSAVLDAATPALPDLGAVLNGSFASMISFLRLKQ